MRKKRDDLQYSWNRVAYRGPLLAKNHRVKFSGKNEVVFFRKIPRIVPQCKPVGYLKRFYEGLLYAEVTPCVVITGTYFAARADAPGHRCG